MSENDYRLRPDPAMFRVKAAQWFKEGDHPAVERFYGAGDRVDELCGHPSHAHGYIHSAAGVLGVCPGDWIVIRGDGSTMRYRPSEFDELYEPASGSRS
jgi:hypothetical protein